MPFSEVRLCDIWLLWVVIEDCSLVCLSILVVLRGFLELIETVERIYSISNTWLSYWNTWP